MVRKSLVVLFVAAITAVCLAASPAAAQRSRPPERPTPEGADGPPARARPDAAPQAGPRGAQGRESQEESEDGWPGGMQERSAAPGQPRIAPGFPQPARWWLGIFAYNTSTGIVVTRVVPNSPAARAGLEPRDHIVTVEGFQVGYVHRRLYALGPELQLRAAPSGQVLLLVQNWRNGELTNMDVRLTPSRTRTPDRPQGRLEGEEVPR